MRVVRWLRRRVCVRIRWWQVVEMERVCAAAMVVLWLWWRGHVQLLCKQK